MRCKEQINQRIKSDVKMQLSVQLSGMSDIEKLLRDQLIQQNRIYTLLITEYGKVMNNETVMTDIQNKDHDHFLSYRQRRMQSQHIELMQKEIQKYATTQSTMLNNIQHRLCTLLGIKQNISRQLTTSREMISSSGTDNKKREETVNELPDHTKKQCIVRNPYPSSFFSASLS
jgi:hypothetical protein